VQSVRNRESNVILLDAGNVFGGSGEAGRRQARVTIEAMALMGYDALNLGEGEFLFGRPFLEEQQERADFPFLSANLVDPDTGVCPYPTHVIKEVDHLKVGIIGLVSPGRDRGREMVTHDPLSSLEAILPAVKGESDLVIVLAQMGYAEAVELIRNVAGVHVMIVSGEGESVTEPVEIDGTLLAPCTHWGMAVGELHIVGNTDGQIVDYRWSQGVLDEQVVDDPGIAELTSGYDE